MILRIEFTQTKSPSFARVLSLCRQVDTFKEREEDGLKIYSVEFGTNAMDSAQAVMDLVHSWRVTAYFLDGKLVSKHAGYRHVWDHVNDAYMDVWEERQRRRRLDRRMKLADDIRQAKTPDQLIKGAEPETDEPS